MLDDIPDAALVDCIQTWCDACEAELPTIDPRHRALAERVSSALRAALNLAVSGQLSEARSILALGSTDLMMPGRIDRVVAAATNAGPQGRLN